MGLDDRGYCKIDYDITCELDDSGDVKIKLEVRNSLNAFLMVILNNIN